MYISLLLMELLHVSHNPAVHTSYLFYFCRRIVCMITPWGAMHGTCRSRDKKKMEGAKISLIMYLRRISPQRAKIWRNNFVPLFLALKKIWSPSVPYDWTAFHLDYPINAWCVNITFRLKKNRNSSMATRLIITKISSCVQVKKQYSIV